MKAFVQNYNEVYSEEFDVEQGSRQGAVPSFLLLNIFFAEALLVALQRFSKDPDIFVALVYLQKQQVKC